MKNNKNIISTNNIANMNSIEIHILKVDLDKIVDENTTLRHQRDDLLCQINKITNDNLIYISSVRQKDEEIEILRKENENLRNEILQLKEQIKRQDDRIKQQDDRITQQDDTITNMKQIIETQKVEINNLNTEIKELKNDKVVSYIRVAINDLDNKIISKLDEKYEQALYESHNDRIKQCHYIDKRYSLNAKMYAQYLLLQKLKTLDTAIISEIDGLDDGFVVALIKAIETENIDITNISIDPRQKHIIDKFWQ